MGGRAVLSVVSHTRRMVGSWYRHLVFGDFGASVFGAGNVFRIVLSRKRSSLLGSTSVRVCCGGRGSAGFLCLLPNRVDAVVFVVCVRWC